MIGGVELGGTKCVVAVGESPENILTKKVIATEDPKSTFKKIRSFFKSYHVEKLGVASFGPIVLDSKSKNYGRLVAESKGGWYGVNVLRSLSRVTSNIFIDTDVNAAAIGEYNYGAGRGSQILVYITIGTGIGGGVLVNGKPYTGNFHLEMGHMLVPNPANFQGICRIHGDCWEGLASGPSIESRWGISPSEIPESHEAWEQEAELLAEGIVSVIANHSPDRIILGGGVMKQKHLFSMVRHKVAEIWNSYTPLGLLSELIVESDLGLDSGIIGSLIIAVGEPAQI